MSIDPNDLNLIERFLLGKLNEAETRVFNERLERDREFARKTRLVTMFPEMLSVEGKTEYDQMQARTSDKEAETKKRKPLKPILFIMAGVIVVMAGVVLFFFLRTTIYETPEKEIAKPVVKRPIQVPVKKEIIKTAEPKPQPVIEKVSEEIELVRPSEGSIFTRREEIVFQWIQRTDSFTRLYVYSATNNKLILWRGIRPGIREYRLPGTTFYPGTFYWFVGRDDPRHTFTVRQ